MSRLPSLGSRGEGWVVIQLVLFGLVLGAGLVRLDAGQASIPLALAGLALVVAGGALAFRGVVDLRGALTPLPHPRDGSELVDSGAYALVRHPIYGGLVLAAAGYALLVGSPLALIGAIALLLYFRLKSAREEAWLRDRYPGYDAYAARTRRLVPFLY